MWNLILVHLETVLVSVQDAPFMPNVPQAQKLFWTHPVILLGDEAQVQGLFSPFGDSANLDTRWIHGLRRMYHQLRSHFGRT
jgi:hypothetical protein